MDRLSAIYIYDGFLHNRKETKKVASIPHNQLNKGTPLPEINSMGASRSLDICKIFLYTRRKRNP